ncbi:MAG: hypothetical protein Q7U16_01975 [Agitococcus sp.]|nr:hypothetical protein [Agitococcus sp.]
MLTHLKVNNLKAVPYLETSTLAKAYPQGINFSTTKPNVVVGPNGSGKSALLTALALYTLSYFTGASAFNDEYIDSTESNAFWQEISKWRNEYEYLPGLTITGDMPPTLYYRPSHIPGNECSITHAFMTGYSTQAREYDKLTRSKSSGQQGKALLQRIWTMVQSEQPTLGFEFINWRGTRHLQEVPEYGSRDSRFVKNELLKQKYLAVPAMAAPLILLDEPEQSLDAKEEAIIWSKLVATDCTKVQVIVATHSWYPLLHPEKFHIIEAVPGYLAEIQALICMRP